MNSTGCISLAGSLLKTRGTPGFFGQLVRQPFLQLNREYHDPCEPLHLSWQWRVKDSPDVQRCSKLCLRKKACPKKRFLPRFKKSFIYHDIFACDPPKEKPKSWGEYLSFLLPDDITSKPQMATCRKMLEHRRRKCMDVDDYSKCVKGECWPLPTEWYGQGVLHISELALTRPPYKPVDSVKPCPPAANTISSCVMKKLPKCPTTLLCLEDTPRKMPYSQFKGADTDGGPPSITLKCPIKYVPEMLPDKHQSRHYKLSCKTYGDYKSVECPPQMFNRYMDVDFSSKNLLPIPTTMPGYTPQREVKKGVCGRQTLLRPPSARNFSTGRALMANDFPEFIKIVNTTHLQPGRSPICFDKLVERAGMNAELLNKPLVERQFDSSQRQRLFTEKELEKHEAEARIAEETPQERKRRLDAKKSKLQMLIEKQEKESKKQDAGETVKSVGNLLSGSQNQPFGGRLVDLEEVPYQRSKFHSSATRFARKGNEKKSSGSGPEEEKICSGCPGIRGAQDPKTKGKSKCAISRGGAKGRCRVNRAIRPEDRLSPLSIKCKGVSDSPCMRQRQPRWDILSSFETRSTTCLGVPSRFDSKRSLNEMKLRENAIYGEKMSRGASFNTTRSDISVPFRSPLTVVLGRSLIANQAKQNKSRFEDEEHGVAAGGTEVLRIFADRYHTKSEKKDRFVPFKDQAGPSLHEFRGPRGEVRSKGFEDLEKQLAQIDRKYKSYQSVSSSGENFDKFFEKIEELPTALRELNEQKPLGDNQSKNARVEKKVDLGEKMKRRKHRRESAEEIHSTKVGITKPADDSDFRTKNSRSAVVSSFPFTLPWKKNVDEKDKRENSKYSGRDRAGKDSFHKAPREASKVISQDEKDGKSHRVYQVGGGPQKRPKQIVVEQAVLDWRKQTAVDSQWMAPSPWFTNEKRSKEDDDEIKESRKGRRQNRNATNVCVDMKSAKTTLKRLVQETTVSQNPKDVQVKEVTEEILERPAARRRTIRAKCSELLALKNNNPEQEGTIRQSHKTMDDMESGAITRLVRKNAVVDIPSMVSDGGARDNQNECSGITSSAKQKEGIGIGSLSDCQNVSDCKSGPECNNDKETQESASPEIISRNSPRTRRRKQLGDECLSVESSFKSDANGRMEPEGPQHSEDNYVESQKPSGDSMKIQNTKQREILRKLDKQGALKEDKMAKCGFGRSKKITNTERPGSVSARETRKQKGFVRVRGSESGDADDKRARKGTRASGSASSSDESHIMRVLTGRQSKKEVEEAVIKRHLTETTSSREISTSSSAMNEKNRWSESTRKFEDKNTTHKKENDVPSSENKVIVLPPPKNSSTYSEIWKHT